MSDGLFAASSIYSGVLLAWEIIKYSYIFVGGDGLYYPGTRIGLLMDVVPIIPEVILTLMAPYWLLRALLYGVQLLTKYVDREWIDRA